MKQTARMHCALPEDFVPNERGEYRMRFGRFNVLDSRYEAPSLQVLQVNTRSMSSTQPEEAGAAEAKSSPEAAGIVMPENHRDTLSGNLHSESSVEGEISSSSVEGSTDEDMLPPSEVAEASEAFVPSGMGPKLAGDPNRPPLLPTNISMEYPDESRLNRATHHGKDITRGHIKVAQSFFANTEYGRSRLTAIQLKHDVINLDGLWMIACKPGRPRVPIIPFLPGTEELRRILIRAVHQSCGHFGIQKTFDVLRRTAYWQDQFKEVQAAVQACLKCRRVTEHARQKHLMMSMEAHHPNHIVAIDHVGRMEVPSMPGEYLHVLTIIDKFSRYLSLVPVRSTSAEESIEALMQGWFSHFGTPDILLMDQGSAFTSHMFTLLGQAFDIQLVHCAARHHQSNGVCERVNRTWEEALRKIVTVRSLKRWHTLLPMVMMSYNHSVHSATGFAPSAIMHGFMTQLPIQRKLGVGAENLYDSNTPHVPSEYVPALLQHLKEIHKSTTENNEASFRAMRQRFNAKVAAPVPWSVGQAVIVQTQRANGALSASFGGPWIVTKLHTRADTRTGQDVVTQLTVKKVRMTPEEVMHTRTIPTGEAAPMIADCLDQRDMLDDLEFPTNEMWETYPFPSLDAAATEPLIQQHDQRERKLASEAKRNRVVLPTDARPSHELPRTPSTYPNDRFDVERIVRMYFRQGTRQHRPDPKDINPYFAVKWVGYASAENTIEPYVNVCECQPLLTFMASKTGQDEQLALDYWLHRQHQKGAYLNHHPTQDIGHGKQLSNFERRGAAALKRLTVRGRPPTRVRRLN